MTLNFGVSQCANGLTVKQNLLLVLCALTEQLVKLISGQMGFRIPVAVVLDFKHANDDARALTKPP